MKQLEVFRKIGGIIKELNEQYQYIETNPENINDLELELFVANAHFLTDHAEILNKLNQRTKAENANTKPADKVTRQLLPPIAPVVKEQQQPLPVGKPEPVAKPLSKNAEQVERALEKLKSLTAEKFFEPVVQQPKRDAKRDAEPEETQAGEATPGIDLTPAAPKDSYSFEMEEPEVIRHELVVDESMDMDEDEELPYEEIAEEEEEETPVVEELKHKEDVEERIAIELGKDPVVEPAKPELKPEEPTKEKDEVFTINQRISAQLGNANNVTEHAHAQPVTNLKQAITLNDKLLYIKDLFNGYSLAYSEAIEILNRFNTFEEANRFLNKNYTVKNNWDSKPETTEKFFALLKRRYS
jgi:hypothetical protein